MPEASASSLRASFQRLGLAAQERQRFVGKPVPLFPRIDR